MSRPAGLAGDPFEFAAMTEISIIAHLADTAFARRLPDGLTTAQFAVLNHLLRLEARTDHRGAGPRASGVAADDVFDCPKRLEEKGLISLVPDSDDRRIRRVSVSRSGTAVRNKAVKALDATKKDLAVLSTGGVETAIAAPEQAADRARRGAVRPYSSVRSTLPRRDLISPRRFFAAIRRRMLPLVGLVRMRRLGFWLALRIISARRLRAASRFRAWLR
jgi:DNA-binding MarR family transcriptional regulator